MSALWSLEKMFTKLALRHAGMAPMPRLFPNAARNFVIWELFGMSFSGWRIRMGGMALSNSAMLSPFEIESESSRV
jgi:hypothetical protein